MVMDSMGRWGYGKPLICAKWSLGAPKSVMPFDGPKSWCFFWSQTSGDLTFFVFFWFGMLESEGCTFSLENWAFWKIIGKMICASSLYFLWLYKFIATSGSILRLIPGDERDSAGFLPLNLSTSWFFSWQFQKGTPSSWLQLARN